MRISLDLTAEEAAEVRSALKRQSTRYYARAGYYNQEVCFTTWPAQPFYQIRDVGAGRENRRLGDLVKGVRDRLDIAMQAVSRAMGGAK